MITHSESGFSTGDPDRTAGTPAIPGNTLMDPPVRINNRQVAAILYEVADLLEQKGVQFKPVAYRRAAHGIENLPEELGEIDEEGKLEEIPGVGTHLSAKIHEILSTGRLAYLDHLEAEIPEGVRKLADLEDIGPEKPCS
jgi:DNA polymerase (family 10)